MSIEARDQCPSEDELAELAERGFGEDGTRLEAHVATCTNCRAALALAVGRSGEAWALSTGALPVTAEPDVAPGSLVGRYRVVEFLGSGAMGNVYVAVDPELDRRVAVKVLRHTREGDATDLSWRLRREAKAMARLSHPNVVGVFDVGTSAGRVFIAMELVTGGTLREWLAAAPRSWREIVEVFLLAGRGLAAAHASGIVHRDFKPDNVLVTAAREVRVTDFGLARAGAPLDDRGPSARGSGEARLSEPPPGESQLTRTGAVVGTPAYMAPEQLDRREADARSDVFSFCVALWEALYGERPFHGTTIGELRQAIHTARAAPEATGDASRSVRDLLAIGLREDPEERYASMTPLLEALVARTRAARPRRAVIWGMMLAACGLAAAIGVGALRRQRVAARACEVAGERVDLVWNDAHAGEIRDSFLATHLSYAEETFTRTANVLSAYAGTWKVHATGYCDAARSSLPDPLATARVECTRQRLTELQAFVDVLRRADAVTLDRALGGAGALVGVDVCDGVDPLQGQTWPGDPATLERTKALRARLVTEEALQDVGHYRDALSRVEVDADEAGRLGFQPLLAETMLLLGRIQRSAGRSPLESEKSFRAAIAAAERCDAARTAASAWAYLALSKAAKLDTALTLDALDHADALLERVGDDERLRARVWLTSAMARNEVGHYDESRDAAEKALPIFERLGDEQRRASAWIELGVAADMQDKRREAQRWYRRAIDLDVTTYGPNHPLVGTALQDLGQSLQEEGKYDESIAVLSRALAMEEEPRGEDSLAVLETQTALADTYLRAGRPAEALPLAERALRKARALIATGSIDEVYALRPLCGALLALHRPAEAVEPAERELALRADDPSDMDVADAKADLGFALLLSRKDEKRGRRLLVESYATKAKYTSRYRMASIEEALGIRLK